MGGGCCTRPTIPTVPSLGACLTRRRVSSVLWMSVARRLWVRVMTDGIPGPRLMFRFLAKRACEPVFVGCPQSQPTSFRLVYMMLAYELETADTACTETELRESNSYDALASCVRLAKMCWERYGSTKYSR